MRHAVFVGATVPPDGQACIDTLDPAIQQLIRDAGDVDEPRPMDPAMAAVVLGNDLTEEQVAWCTERMVAEAPGLTTEPVDHAPLHAVSRTWIRTLQDLIVPAEKQLAFAEGIEPCAVVDIDAGHMCMVSQPATTAATLNEVAAR